MSGPDELNRLEQQITQKRNFNRPPLHLWEPSLSGEIPIRIDAGGHWYHEGVKIQRESLVRLFASILRREDDGEYYLVTPVEKWRLQVDLHPLVVVDASLRADDKEPLLEVQLNTGQSLVVGHEYPLFLEDRVGGVAAVSLWHGLSAIFSRAAWVRLVEIAEEEQDGLWVVSGSERFCLGTM